MNRIPIKVFISYAHDDEHFFEVFKAGLNKHLFTSPRYDFGVWDDSKILPGLKWDDEIQNRLAESDLAILCVSAGFLGSEYVKIKEFGNLIKKYPNILIIPVYFNHCNFELWEELAEKQFFKPAGAKYGKVADDDFSFCNLVELKENAGRFIALPNQEVDRYFMNFTKMVESVLASRHTGVTVVNTPGSSKKTVYINPGNYPYFEKDNFFGREELLKQMDEHLKEPELPLLLSGIGGMGKTASAIAYGKTPEYANNYDHIAWVSVTDTVFSNLFSTFRGNPVLPFEYNAEGNTDTDKAAMLQLLKNVSGNNLLLVDNVNNEEELQEFIGLWKMYQPGWKCIITTRCENNAYRKNLLRLQVLSPDAAEQLYKNHNHEDEFDRESFNKIYEYIGGHTFLVELLAKFAEESSTIRSTKDVLNHLLSKGIKALTRSVLAKQGQQQETDKMVSEFVLGLYDPLVLPEKEKTYMRYFSVLPATEIEFAKLVFLFGIEKDKEEDFDIALRSLAKTGWLMYNKSSFKCHQIIQEICREKLKPDENNCKELLHPLITLFDELNLAKALPYFEISYSIISNIKGSAFEFALLMLNFSDLAKLAGNLSNVIVLLIRAEEIFTALRQKFNKAICNDRIGDIYLLFGDTTNAMEYYKRYNELALLMAEESPDDTSVKSTLAISFFKIGQVLEEEKKWDEAMGCFERVRDTAIEMAKKYPGEIKFKNILAGSYARIGDISIEKNETGNARSAYEQFNAIAMNLSAEYPLNEEYKNNLSISYCKLGDVCQEENDSSAAGDYFRKYYTLKKELADKHPENVFYQNGLAISLQKLADVTAGDEKKKYLLSAKDIWEQLVLKVPENVSYKNSLNWVNEKLTEE